MNASRGAIVTNGNPMTETRSSRVDAHAVPARPQQEQPDSLDPIINDLFGSSPGNSTPDVSGASTNCDTASGTAAAIPSPGTATLNPAEIISHQDGRGRSIQDTVTNTAPMSSTTKSPLYCQSSSPHRSAFEPRILKRRFLTLRGVPPELVDNPLYGLGHTPKCRLSSVDSNHTAAFTAVQQTMVDSKLQRDLTSSSSSSEPTTGSSSNLSDDRDESAASESIPNANPPPSSAVLLSGAPIESSPDPVLSHALGSLPSAVIRQPQPIDAAHNSFKSITDWFSDEVQLLHRLVNEYGSNWVPIARMLRLRFGYRGRIFRETDCEQQWARVRHGMCPPITTTTPPPPPPPPRPRSAPLQRPRQPQAAVIRFEELLSSVIVFHNDWDQIGDYWSRRFGRDLAVGQLRLQFEGILRRIADSNESQAAVAMNASVSAPDAAPSASADSTADDDTMNDTESVSDSESLPRPSPCVDMKLSDSENPSDRISKDDAHQPHSSEMELEDHADHRSNGESVSGPNRIAVSPVLSNICSSLKTERRNCSSSSSSNVILKTRPDPLNSMLSSVGFEPVRAMEVVEAIIEADLSDDDPSDDEIVRRLIAAHYRGGLVQGP